MEAAGLAIGLVGLAGLFGACIESLDIVVNVKHFSEDYNLLCTQLDLQRLRLLLWGESLGLIPSPEGKQIPYNYGIDRPDIRPAIEQALNHLRLLLQKADLVTDRYDLQSQSNAAQAQSSQSLKIFQGTFEAFKAKIRRNQKEKSKWAKSRWSVHDYDKFKDLIENMRGLIDSLEGITNALGVLNQQHARLTQEIESISDVQSLRLLQEVSSAQSSSKSSRLVSDTASHRLCLFNGSWRSEACSSVYQGTISSKSYHTAPETLLSQSTEDTTPGIETERPLHQLAIRTLACPPLTEPAADIKDGSNAPPNKRQRKDSRLVWSTRNGKERESTPVSEIDVPQNQRMIADLIRKRKLPHRQPELSFQSGAGDYGKAISAVRADDEELWSRECKRLIQDANNSKSTAQRVFLELRSIRRAAVPFISAAPISDELDKVLASIEGPPDTPYAGGIFWISVRFLESNGPMAPPLLRFQTRIYHPNIDCSGKICADYHSWWEDPRLRRYLRGTGTPREGAWFSSQNFNWYSLGAVLTALCGLLASPNIEDPLVPEIAEVYLNDYDGFCKAAELYTKRYALEGRPVTDSIVYAQPPDENGVYQQPTAGSSENRAPKSASLRALVGDTRQHITASTLQEDTEQAPAVLAMPRHRDELFSDPNNLDEMDSEAGFLEDLYGELLGRTGGSQDELPGRQLLYQQGYPVTLSCPLRKSRTSGFTKTKDYRCYIPLLSRENVFICAYCSAKQDSLAQITTHIEQVHQSRPCQNDSFNGHEQRNELRQHLVRDHAAVIQCLTLEVMTQFMGVA